jgi:hypothetical protein
LKKLFELQILAMRLRKRGWQCILVVTSVFGGRKNLLLKGLYWLGDCYRYGFGCEEDLDKAKESFLVAAELGHVDAIVYMGCLFDKTDPPSFVWFGKAAANGCDSGFLNEMVDQINNFSFDAKVLFAIGRALKGYVNNEDRTIFGKGYKFDAYIRPANQAFHFYELVAIVSKSGQQLDNCWIEKWSCEGHPKDDWDDDLGCERRSRIFGAESARHWRRAKS